MGPRKALRCCLWLWPLHHLLKSTNLLPAFPLPQVILLPLLLAALESSSSPSSSPASSQALGHSDLVGGRRKAVGEPWRAPAWHLINIRWERGGGASMAPVGAWSKTLQPQGGDRSVGAAVIQATHIQNAGVPEAWGWEWGHPSSCPEAGLSPRPGAQCGQRKGIRERPHLVLFLPPSLLSLSPSLPPFQGLRELGWRWKNSKATMKHG